MFFSELIEDFKFCLREIFKQFNFLWFPIEGGHFCCQGFGQFWNSVDGVTEIGGVMFACQLLKGKQNLVCSNCRKGVPTEEMWLTCGARLPQVSWRSPKGAVGNHFLNSCHPVRRPVQVGSIWMTGLTDGWSHLSMRINLQTIYIWLPVRIVFWNVPGTVPECVLSCGLKRRSSRLKRAPKMQDSDQLNSWDSFSVTLLSVSSETCVIFSSIPRTDVFCDWPFLGYSPCVSLATAATLRPFLKVVISLKVKNAQQ